MNIGERDDNKPLIPPTMHLREGDRLVWDFGDTSKETLKLNHPPQTSVDCVDCALDPKLG
jgi:hypothetical protein